MPRAATAMDGSTNWRLSEVRMPVLERSEGCHALMSSITYSLRRALRYISRVLSLMDMSLALTLPIIVLSVSCMYVTLFAVLSPV